MLGGVVKCLVRLPNLASSRRTLPEADVVDLPALVAHSQLEPRMRAALVCSVEALVSVGH